MKKGLAILLFLIYGSTSFGMNLYFHFCCPDPVEQAAVAKHACCDKQTSQQGDDTCCNDRVIDFKINGEYDNAKVINFTFFQFDAVKPGATEISFERYSGIQNFQPALFTSIPFQKDRNQLFCVYRI